LGHVLGSSHFKPLTDLPGSVHKRQSPDWLTAMVTLIPLLMPALIATSTAKIIGSYSLQHTPFKSKYFLPKLQTLTLVNSVANTANSTDDNLLMVRCVAKKSITNL